MIKTFFEKNEIQESALFTPADTTKEMADFPEICVSIEEIIQRMDS